MALLTQFPSTIPVLTVSRLHHKHPKLCKYENLLGKHNLPCPSCDWTIRCSNASPWEPAPITYAPENEGTLLKEASNIFEAMTSSRDPDEASITKTDQHTNADNRPFMQLRYLRWPLWILGPSLLLITGVVPTLWLPISSIFLGPNIASLLSLTGLDCIFNLGASLFLLMADSSARPDNICRTKPPPSYRFWNVLANVFGFIVPLGMFLVSQKGFLGPQLPFISFGVLLGPLLSAFIGADADGDADVALGVAGLASDSVVYEAYRLLQLMRGLKLGAELGAPAWTMHVVRGLVCGWVLVLGVQLMRVAWYAGFTARAYRQQCDVPADG